MVRQGVVGVLRFGLRHGKFFHLNTWQKFVCQRKNRSATKKILKFFFRSETIALDGLRAWHSQNFAFASAGVGDSWDDGGRICFYVSFFAFLFTIARHTV